MSATLKIKVKQLDADFVREMQEKYADAELEIKVNKSTDFKSLEKHSFWEIIGLLDWDQQDDEAIINPAVKQLAALPVAHIYQFQDILSEKLYQLDHRKYAEQIGQYAYKVDQYFSVDHFLYARACVVANGKAAYEEVLNDPCLMPKDVTFEALLRIAPEAYGFKTGKEFIYAPSYNYETYSNEVGWK